MRWLQSFRWPVKLAMLVIALLAVIAIGSGWWLPWDPAAIDLQQRLLPPGAAHWLGTDHLGRDIFSRLLAATRVSLGAVMACLLLVLLIGLAVGGCAGLLGGRADRGLMRIAELFMTFPTSILSFFMVGVLGTGLTNVILAIALSHWAWYARMVRNLVVSLRQREFILAARLSGASQWRQRGRRHHEPADAAPSRGRGYPAQRRRRRRQWQGRPGAAPDRGAGGRQPEGRARQDRHQRRPRDRGAERRAAARHAGHHRPAGGGGQVMSAQAQLQDDRQPLIRLRGITKVYGEGELAFQALKGVDLDIEQGDFVAIMGPSGSGKSTAMNTLGCLDRPSSGSYLFRGMPVQALSRDDRARLRRRFLGFVFQGFNLLARTSAQENVELPLLDRGASAAARHALAARALEAVGLKGWEHHTPAELSGGQQQRVAIARAIVTEPAVLLADEPTGNLDTQRSREIMELLWRLNVDRGITVLMVTHEHDMAAWARRIVRFVDGVVADDTRNPEPAGVLEDAARAAAGQASPGAASAPPGVPGAA